MFQEVRQYIWESSQCISEVFVANLGVPATCFKWSPERYPQRVSEDLSRGFRGIHSTLPRDGVVKVTAVLRQCSGVKEELRRGSLRLATSNFSILRPVFRVRVACGRLPSSSHYGPSRRQWLCARRGQQDLKGFSQLVLKEKLYQERGGRVLAGGLLSVLETRREENRGS